VTFAGEEEVEKGGGFLRKGEEEEEEEFEGGAKGGKVSKGMGEIVVMEIGERSMSMSAALTPSAEPLLLLLLLPLEKLLLFHFPPALFFTATRAPETVVGEGEVGRLECL